MKKLLIFMLVLGMVSVANATLSVEIQQGGVAVDEITLSQGGSASDIQVVTTVEISSGVNEGYYVLIAETSKMTVTGEATATIYDANCFILDDAVGNGISGVPSGWNGVFGGAFSFGAPTIPIGGRLADGIKITDVSAGPYMLRLWEIADDGVTLGDMFDEVTIIPEPATIALLGLGGLLLRRRK